jgi:hypothetical protein
VSDPRPIVLVAMGGHAFMQPGEAGTIEDHERNAARIAALLMSLSIGVLVARRRLVAPSLKPHQVGCPVRG